LQLRSIFALILATALPVLYIIIQTSGTLLIQSADTAFVLFTGACTILAFMMIMKMGARGRLGLMHVGMFTGMLLVFLGTLATGIYAIVLRTPTPVPSVADILNFGGYASAALATLQFLWYFRAGFSKLQFKLTPFLGALVAGPNLILSHPNLATQTPLIVEGTWIAYPLLDGFLVVLAVMVLLLFNEGIVSSCWRWLAVGMILITLADAVIGIGNVQGWSQFVEPFNIFYFWGYICLGLGFSLMPRLERLHPLDRDYHKARIMQPLD